MDEKQAEKSLVSKVAVCPSVVCLLSALYSAAQADKPAIAS